MQDHDAHAAHAQRTSGRATRAGHGGHARPYLRLLAMTTGSFVAMYILMYMMVDAFRDALPNINQLYMAAMMTAPMVVIELVSMRSMFPNRRANLAIAGAAALVLVGSIALLRGQTGVRDKELLRAMIPHHSGAILMCERAALRDTEIQGLCRDIVASQQAEIRWMKDKLERL